MSAPWTPAPGVTRCPHPPRAVEARLAYRAWLASLPGRAYPCKPAPVSFEVVGPCVVVVDFLEELRRLGYDRRPQTMDERQQLAKVMYG